jgi:hypothetical protein
MPVSLKEIPVDSWSDFEARVRQLIDDPGIYPRLFRGLGNGCWGLETTLERSYPNERCDETLSLLKYYRKALAAKPALETFSGRRWDRLPDLEAFGKNLKEHRSAWLDDKLRDQNEIYEYLVYLRHQGFPSPLLDWTASPYVAAFFAFDTVPENVDRVCVYALGRGGGGSYDQHCYILGPYMRTHQRHFLQQSWYSMCVRSDPDGEDYVFRRQEPAFRDDLGPAERLLKLTIPSKERQTVLQHLVLMYINPFSLFGSEDSLVRTVARRECYFKNWHL